MTTYYWRIDEVVDETTVIKGDIWRFTTAPLKAHTPVPADGTLYVNQILSLPGVQVSMSRQADIVCI